MSDAASDEFPEFAFSFPEEDLAELDASIAAILEQGHSVTKTSDAEDPTLESSQSDTVVLSNDVDNGPASSSFASDAFNINLSTLSAEELHRLDGFATPTTGRPGTDGPSIEIELEQDSAIASQSVLLSKNETVPSANVSPLKEFRSHMQLSVTDLCAPSWCEVQYDYGLRGKRSRPLKERPTNFLSSSGKTISPAATVAEANDAMTKQGLAIHKELEREIKAEEIRVDVTTEETRWALRLINMIASLQGMMEGFTREMPVFGILQDEVVVGIMDEVTKLPSLAEGSPLKRHKGPSSSPKPSNEKPANISPPSSQTSLDSFFESPKKSAERDLIVQQMEISKPKPISYTLFIKDNKTRKHKFIPSDPDMYSSRIQLMIYRRLLSQLVSVSPPYDFQPLWTKLGLKAEETFPIRFLEQAQLIKPGDPICLDDLTTLWHKVVKESNITGVSPVLELVYWLRPPGDRKPRRRSNKVPRWESTSSVDEDLEKAIAASLDDLENGVEGNNHLVQGSGSLDFEHSGAVSGHASRAKRSFADLEEAQLQWALHQSLNSSSDNSGVPVDMQVQTEISSATELTESTKSTDDGATAKDAGIQSFKIIGTKKFMNNDRELDIYLTQVLMWWRGERKPSGVSLEHSYRCSTCEYASDCEWRAEKALEYSNRNKE